jgi:secreted PhoX family phosphatase
VLCEGPQSALRLQARQEPLERRISRRALLGRAMPLAPAIVLTPPLLRRAEAARGPAFQSTSQGHGLTFEAITLDSSDRLVVPPGYTATVLLKWGDPLFSGVPALDINAQTAAFNSISSGTTTTPLASFHFRSTSQTARTTQ